MISLVNNYLKCYITGTQSNNIDIILNKDKLTYELSLRFYEIGNYEIYILNNENENILNSPIKVKCIDPCDNFAYYKTSKTTVYIKYYYYYNTFIYIFSLIFTFIPQTKKLKFQFY